MPDFLKKYQISKVYADLETAVREQYEKGNITENDIRKFIELMKNTFKLKIALKHL